MARPAQFGKDTGLQVRMLTTMFLLGLVYVIFAGVIFAAGGGAVAIALFAAVMLAVQFFASDDDDNPSFAVVILVSILVYVVSFLLIQALSRYREFAADRGAAVITGRPSALSSALLKISGSMERTPATDLRAAGELNAFFIVPASVKNSVFNLFATHPPMEKRIEALSRLET